MRYYRENFVTTPDGAELWYAVLGEGEKTLVMNDGLGCEGFIWKHLIRQLGEEHRIVRWNYRGHGRSGLPLDDTRISIGHFADDLALVMKATGTPRAVHLAHSMGIQVSFEFHKRYPELVEALIPICGAYGHPLDTFHDADLARRVFPYLLAAVEAFPAVARRLVSTLAPSEASLQFARFTELNRHLVKRDDFAPYLEHLGKMDPRIFFRLLASGAAHTAWDHLPTVKVPVLVVAGEKDRFTPVWLSQRMHSAIPDSELLIVPSGTHTAPIELPELISLRIDRFLRDRVVGRTSAVVGAPVTATPGSASRVAG